MSKEKEEKEVKGSPSFIVGWVIPDIPKDQLTSETRLFITPVFASEKGLYKKKDTFPSIEEAKAELLARYGRTN